jgi:hypothetical protein
MSTHKGVTDCDSPRALGQTDRGQVQAWTATDGIGSAQLAEIRQEPFRDVSVDEPLALAAGDGVELLLAPFAGQRVLPSFLGV